MKVEIRSLQEHSLAVGSSGSRTVTIDRSTEAGGLGLGFNGGELLLLAIGGCFSNDLYRESPKFGVQISSVHIEVSCDWGGEPVRAQNVTLCAHVKSDAPATTIRELIAHTSSVAEIPNSLRLGTTVRIVDKQ
jgi:putative redox protein